MDSALLIAFLIAALIGVGTFLRIARPVGRRREPRSEHGERGDLVTGNLDFSILGQRPEIVTEDEAPDSRSAS